MTVESVRAVEVYGEVLEEMCSGIVDKNIAHSVQGLYISVVCNVAPTMPAQRCVLERAGVCGLKTKREVLRQLSAHTHDVRMRDGEGV